MKDSRKKHGLPGRGLRLLKWLLPLGVVAGLVALAFVPKPVVIDVAAVTRDAMMLTIEDDGVTRIRERYTISAPLGGRLARIDLDPGDQVKKGDVLAILNPGPPDLLDPRAAAQAVAMVKSAEAALTRAEAQRQATQDEKTELEKPFRRNEGLHARGNISDAVLEESERAYLAASHADAAAAAAVEMARFEVEQAHAALLHTEPDQDHAKQDPGEWDFVIRSPIDGQVLFVHEVSSRVLSAGAPLLEIGDLRALEMQIDVLSQLAAKIEPGQKILVAHWGGETTLAGRVRLVEPAAFTKVSALGVDEQRVHVLADFDELPAEASSLGHGFRIEARIVIWEGAEVLQVPAGALFRKGEQWAAYRVEAEHAKLTLLGLGRNNGEVAEVRSGLSAGDHVVLHPGDRIEDGTLVERRK